MRAAALGRADDIADLFDRILHPQRLLVEKRPGAGGAFAGTVVIDDVRAFQPNVLGAFAADLEHRAHLRVERADGARDGLEFVLEKQPEHLRDGPAPRPGHADAFDPRLRNRRVKLVQQVVGGLNRAAGNAPISGEHQRPAAERAHAELGIGGAQGFEHRPVRRSPRAASLRLIAPMSSPILMAILIPVSAGANRVTSK